ncbi:hypothetical protein [Glycomyces sp. NPDC048151]|uniref:hypothetical protein n=1 Tax=Glycomyces sp. NPDC048151 TaxID=3364002 RepID=UPI00371ABEFC
MSNYDPNLLELMTAIIGSVAAVAAVAGAVIQYKSAKLELQRKQDGELPGNSRPDGKPPQ